MNIEHSVNSIIKETVANAKGQWGIVYKDLSSGVEVVHHPDDVFASASLIKIPILVGMMFAADEGLLDLSERLTLSKPARTDEDEHSSGILLNLSDPLSVTVHDLCALMIMVSDNFATNHLLSMVGMGYVNKKIAGLGLTVTRVNHIIANFAELRDSGVNPMTAREAAQLLEMIYRRQLPMADKMERILEKQVYGNRIPYFLPFEDPNLRIAHKTGTLNSVAHDAGILRTKSGDYLLCVLTQQQEAIGHTSLAIAELSAQIFEHFQSRS